ncbi:hypothetical protein J2S74_005201 [Evansella vedderi]|uniref:Uncharacterized protein n=1 Tax=Evansella vedderi TaxID=38282 RepID=A0ABU0A3S1_9BACI|nr:hypothetical protein [Evansella vedderi]MDQ0257739.1 hypothetical protein [Evansella vedderi]
MASLSKKWMNYTEEISNGVIQAIRKKEKELTVGQLEPWEQRP